MFFDPFNKFYVNQSINQSLWKKALIVSPLVFSFPKYFSFEVKINSNKTQMSEVIFKQSHILLLGSR